MYLTKSVCRSGMSPFDLRRSPLAIMMGMTLIVLTGVIEVTNGLQCYKCDGKKDCRKTWEQLLAERGGEPGKGYVVKLDTCSSPKEQCQLHFSTYHHTIHGTTEASRKGAMIIHRAGCAPPPANIHELDDAGCISKPRHRIPGTGTDAVPWWSGSHGTRTCYCNNADKCNHNYLECFCSKQSCTTGIETSSLPNWAQECSLRWKHDYSFTSPIQNMLGFGFDVDGPSYPKCNSMSDNAWGTVDSCRCATSLCNKVPPKLEAYMAEPIPKCMQCISSYDCGKDYGYSCPRRSLCSSHYPLRRGRHVLKQLGCATPPIGQDGKVIRNGCYPPDLKSNVRNRTCFCDTGDYCNTLDLQCYTCNDPDSCKQPQKMGCENGTTFSEEKAEECFIRYDGTVSPPELEAGCRPFTLEMDEGLDGVDPFCSQELQGGWIGSKGVKSCRCETSGCNEFLKKLALEEGEDPDETGMEQKQGKSSKSGGGIGISKLGSNGRGRFIMIMTEAFILCLGI